jgi:hypothetical protein
MRFLSDRVTAQYRDRRVHLFPWTGGGPEDGSLYRQVTYCGHVVDDINVWTENGAPVTCGTCLRLERRAARASAGDEGRE